MIKRIVLVLFAVLLVAFSAVPAFADFYGPSLKVYDEGDLLTESEEDELRERLDLMSEEYGCEVVVATVETLGDIDAEEYSDYLYDTMHYGMYNDGKCIMLLICMEYRDWALTPYGEASDYFPMSVQDEMVDSFLPYLSDEDFYSAFSTFADYCEYTFATYEDYGDSFYEDYEDYGDEYFEEYYPSYEYEDTVRVEPLWIVAALVIGIAIAFIVVLIMKSQLKSVRFQPAANSYVKSGSLNVTMRRDIFLYYTVTRTPKPKNNSSGGGIGGGGIGGSAGPRSSGKF